MNITNLASDTPVGEQVMALAENCKLAIDRDRANAFNAIDAAIHAAKTKAEEIDRFTKMNVLDLAGAVFFGTHTLEMNHSGSAHPRIEFTPGMMCDIAGPIRYEQGKKYKITLLVTEEKDATP
jgi:hypothetical protein